MTWDRSRRTPEDVARTLAQRLQHYEEHGFGVLAVLEKETGRLIGQCGLQYLKGTHEIELVAYTAKSEWRRGLAAEACTAMLDHAFLVMGTKSVLAVARVENAAARTLCDKLGFMAVRGDRLYDADVAVYVLEAVRWLPTRTHAR